MLKTVKSSVITTILCMVWSSATASVKMDDCRACHGLDLMLIKHKFEIVDACKTCHKQSAKHARVKAENKTTSNRPPNEHLAVPMYYKVSRIGGRPNKMAEIPAGEFVMGSNNRMPDEGPEHKRRLKTYYIDLYEVTNLQYKAFIDATGRRSPKHFRNRTYPEGKADHPVTNVSWKDANRYCKWAGKRLPTDAEWEKAARGSRGKIFPWGNEFDIDKANTPQRWKILGKKGDTSPVGAFPEGKSPYGLFDMSGNVWEWTDSWYEPYPGNTHKTENYGHKYKTLKGGSWWDCSFYQCGISAPLFNRSFFLRSTKNNSFGFRCAADRPPRGVEAITATSKYK